MVTVRVSSIISTVFVVVFDDNKIVRIYTGAAWEYHTAFKWRSMFAAISTARSEYSDFLKEENGGVSYSCFTIPSIEAADKVIRDYQYKMKQVYAA